jgi:hypothetical protein
MQKFDRKKHAAQLARVMLADLEIWAKKAGHREMRWPAMVVSGFGASA